MNHKSHLHAYAVLLASAATLVACGGGESASQPTAHAASVHAKVQSVKSPMAVTPILPGDPSWGTTSACTTDADFVRVDGSTDPDAVLKSRHVACMLLTPDAQDVEVDLMPTADGSKWMYYDPSAGRSPTTFTVGSIQLYTKFQVYGPATSLVATHQLSFVVNSFVPNPNFPLPVAGMTLALTPNMTCNQVNGGNGAVFAACSPLTGFGATIPLTTGATVAGPAVPVTLGWSLENIPDASDWASFKVALASIDYTVVGSKRATGNPSFNFESDGASGSMVAPEIRCDRGIVQVGRQGCVMPRAAAVFVMNASADPRLVEVTQHVLEAQTTLTPGQSQQAPGVFQIKPGTRAVMAENLSGQYQGLQREVSTAAQTANRTATCGTQASSLYNSRPYYGSSACPTQGTAGCSCDEFPFASTKQGGANTFASVKGITATSNSYGGSLLSAFLLNERVFPPEVAADQYWVQPIPLPGRSGTNPPNCKANPRSCAVEIGRPF